MPKETETVTMNLGGFGNKILSTADQNAYLIGAGMGVLQMGQSLVDSITNALTGQLHPPDLQWVAGNIDQPQFKTAVLVALGGYIAQESGIDILKKIGSIAQKGATAYALIYALDKLLWGSTHSGGGGNAGGSPAQGYGY